MADDLAQIATWCEGHNYKDPPAWHTVASNVAATVGNLRVERDELLADRERLDWLDVVDSRLLNFAAGGPYVCIREAIDAARSVDDDLGHPASNAQADSGSEKEPVGGEA